MGVWVRLVAAEELDIQYLAMAESLHHISEEFQWLVAVAREVRLLVK